jgi:hypothetical protein
MTTPFTVNLLVQQAFETYYKFKPTTAASSSQQLLQQQPPIKKALLYAVGATVMTAVFYKSIRYLSAANSWWAYIFLRPFKRLLTRKEEKDKQIPFENKYFKEYDEWVARQQTTTPPDDNNYVIVSTDTTHKKECLENLYYTMTRDTIDDFYGDVIMCYDHATLSFAYYARTANIPYKYLETISRKYMIETNAPREIHVDIRDEFKKAKERIATADTATADTATTDTATADTATVGTATDDVFVKLKSYNTVSNLNIHTTSTNDTNKNTHKFASSNPAPTTNKVIICEKTNRYSYRGKISEFDEKHAKPIKPAAVAGNTEEVTPGYAEFKKQMMKTRSAL